MRYALTKTFTVTRLAKDGVGEKYVAAGTIMGAMFPISAEDTMLSEGNPAKMYKVLADIDADLKETDKLSIGGVDYTVKGIRKFDFGALSRLEAIVADSEF